LVCGVFWFYGRFCLKVEASGNGRELNGFPDLPLLEKHFTARNTLELFKHLHLIHPSLQLSNT
jgi:hypothetical protein